MLVWGKGSPEQKSEAACAGAESHVLTWGLLEGRRLTGRGEPRMLFRRCCELRTQLCVVCRAPLRGIQAEPGARRGGNPIQGAASGSPAPHRLSYFTDQLGELAGTTRLPDLLIHLTPVPHHHLSQQAQRCPTLIGACGPCSRGQIAQSRAVGLHTTSQGLCL